MPLPKTDLLGLQTVDIDGKTKKMADLLAEKRVALFVNVATH